MSNNDGDQVSGGSDYFGPNSGKTPDDDTELRGNGSNPYSQGSPQIDLTDTTDQHFGVFGSGTPGAYYNNPAVVPNGNPYSAGAGTYTPDTQDVANNMANSLADLYLGILANQQVPSDAAGATSETAQSDYDQSMYRDGGFGNTGTGRS